MIENQNGAYIKILVDTLRKKKEALQFLTELTKEQENILLEDKFSLESFDETVEKKEKIIQNLNQLDDGFEVFYQRVELVIQKEKYFEELKTAQKLISEITEMSTRLQAKERQNKEKLSRVLMEQRQEIRNFKTSSETAQKYYSNMANQHRDGQSYFLDRKK